MCTVSWLRLPEGYKLFCNRDERHTRKPAIAPYLQIRSDVQFLAPADGDHGGAWIGVNEFRVACCLVNRYSCCPKALRNHQSRGILLHGLLDCPSQEAAYRRIQRIDLASYQPFTMVILEPGRASMLLHWTGHDSLVEWNGDYAMPLVSSSFDPEGVAAYRRRLMHQSVAEQGSLDAGLLERFHASHAPLPCAYSACMHREDASTVSFSRIRVSGTSIQFSYQDQAPCAQSLLRTVAMEAHPSSLLLNLKRSSQRRFVSPVTNGAANLPFDRLTA